ncbi:MAG: M28 family peptidase [Nitrospinae bacterium]|jgi:glutaminyl-peptide cyclotransferase|nr:M28 family peptidase [Nitrospinota bacterium]MDA1108823.1 M28 family peptidase [Nitrospinota bacterium]
MRKIWQLALLTGILICQGGIDSRPVGAQELQVHSESAWSYLKTLTGFGPRNPGSPGYLKTMELIKRVGRKYADEIDEQVFFFPVGNGKKLKMSNFRLQFKGNRKGAPILIGAHFDTRPYADEESSPSLQSRPILGANDGGSGTAVLLALAEYLKQNRDRRSVEMVFFDGEDYGRKGSGENLLGSTHYASQLRESSPDTWPYCVIVIDMIGDRDLQIFRETHSVKSASWLVDLIHDSADAKKVSQFINKSKYTIFDDHYPFIGLGIPSVVLIDFDYPHWHKMTDTLDKCSPESLFSVFSVVVEALGKI